MRNSKLSLLFLILASHLLISRPANAADDTIEIASTCERLGRLITNNDVEKILGTKILHWTGPVVDGIDGCKIEIDGIKGAARRVYPSPAQIGVTLKQHLSPRLALASRTVVPGSPNKPDVIAETDRSSLVAIKFGYPYFNVVVDSTEVNVILRDKTIAEQHGRAMGKLIYERAAVSADIASYKKYSNEVAAFVALRPFGALVARCLAPDVEGHDVTRRAIAASKLARLRTPELTKLTAYAQRWITVMRLDEAQAPILQRINMSTNETIASECARMTVELPEFEKRVATDVVEAFSSSGQ